MKKFITILLVFICFISFVGCKKEYIRANYSSIYDENVAYTVDDFIETIKNEQSFKNKEFYIIAPQYFRQEDRINSLMIGKRSRGDEFPFDRIGEIFYVCNEERYGNQITDWGQNGGIAVNFKIDAIIDANYYEEITQLNFQYIDRRAKESYGVTNNNETTLVANIFNGNICFATVEWVGYGYKDEQTAKSCFEGYVSEFLMSKSEYITRYESGEFKSSDLSVDEMNFVGNGYFPIYGTDLYYYYRYYNDKDIIYNKIRELTNVHIYPEIVGLKAGSYWAPGFSAKDVDAEGNYVEPYYFERIALCPDELYRGHKMHLEVYELTLIINRIPLGDESFNKEKISFVWNNDLNMVNILYDGYCFSSAKYIYYEELDGDPEARPPEYVREFTEEYILRNITFIG